ncbi:MULTISPECIES: type III secretion system outer membrane ring subunit SctC [Pseudomonas]|uniref:Type 3 secretion system secretin n=1 Tax=Pseudomonas frederiksbergensis TaxID=104087 RepID=A0A0B1Z3A0_9PSED|nr:MULTISPECIES: type III secretion system outer membrane ring subunit SctC [Pseudomonas]KHK65075.1 secretin [Pseudomonas frederiksbergensis]KJH81153.1 secretin [Pseudomonas fluorescens]WRV68170.1 type III secretion system outer membrane ring subunit SctC [Pseudomonas frederiksbergensis]
MPNRWLAPYCSMASGKVSLGRSIAHRWTKTSLLALALAAALGAGMPVEAAVPTDWKNTPYAYDAQNTPLPKVLGDFANTFGVQLVLDGTVKGTVDGRMRADSPQAFLDRLGLENRFQWFIYGNTMYVSPLQNQTSKRLEVSADAAPDMKQALTDIGLLDSRFGWGELPDEGVVLVSGPERYVRLVARFAEARKTPEEKQEVISFPLRYATAADRSVNYRGDTLVIPGVATILKGLLESRSAVSGGMQATSPQGAFQNMQAQQSMSMGNIEQLALNGMGRPNTNRVQPGGNTSSGGRGRIRVEADVRNNAVLIYDSPKRREIYTPLIRDVDVPRKLVEIDAIILDIDRTQLAELASNWNVESGDLIGGASMIRPGASSTVFIQDYGDFSAQLRALEGRGLASVVANPSVLTLENQPAVIDFSRTEYISAIGERVATVEPITAGTSLQVVPHTIETGGRNQIQMFLDIEDGRIEPSEVGQQTPSVRRGVVSTQAVMGESRSLVVGGFHTEETGDNLERVPWLGRIPLIGPLLFSSTTRETSRRERVFILTPRLIGDQVDPARYISALDREQVDSAMARLEERRNGTRPIGRVEVSDVLAQLADGNIPATFKQATSIPYSPDTLCALQPGLSLDAGRAQWFAGPDYGIAVGVVRNDGDRRLRFDEASCSTRWTLASSAWPKVWLEPGEETEVFVVMKQPKRTPGGGRASLLQTSARTAP